MQYCNVKLTRNFFSWHPWPHQAVKIQPAAFSKISLLHSHIWIHARHPFCRIFDTYNVVRLFESLPAVWLKAPHECVFAEAHIPLLSMLKRNSVNHACYRVWHGQLQAESPCQDWRWATMLVSDVDHKGRFQAYRIKNAVLLVGGVPKFFPLHVISYQQAFIHIKCLRFRLADVTSDRAIWTVNWPICRRGFPFRCIWTRVFEKRLRLLVYTCMCSLPLKCHFFSPWTRTELLVAQWISPRILPGSLHLNAENSLQERSSGNVTARVIQRNKRMIHCLTKPRLRKERTWDEKESAPKHTPTRTYRTNERDTSRARPEKTVHVHASPHSHLLMGRWSRRGASNR